MTDDIVARLNSSHAFLGDPLHKEAADEIERMRDALRRISHAPHGKMYCANGHEEAVLIARAAHAVESDNIAVWRDR